jgi:hypothetical protein
LILKLLFVGDDMAEKILYQEEMNGSRRKGGVEWKT